MYMLHRRWSIETLQQLSRVHPLSKILTTSQFQQQSHQQQHLVINTISYCISEYQCVFVVIWTNVEPRK